MFFFLRCVRTEMYEIFSKGLRINDLKGGLRGNVLYKKYIFLIRRFKKNIHNAFFFVCRFDKKKDTVKIMFSEGY
jgi:hypothetical protein